MSENFLNIVVLVSGSGSNLQSIIDHIGSGDLDARIDAVVSDNPDAYGLERARQAAIPARVLLSGDYQTREAYDAALTELVAQYDPQLIVLAGFMRILGEGFVNNFNSRIVNIHPSLLPKYRCRRCQAWRNSPLCNRGTG